MVWPAIIAAASAIGGGLLAKSGADADREFQMQAARHGIKWRVEDAKEAGVHPLFALGAPTFNPSPVGDGGAGAVLAQGGQDVSRALHASADLKQRTEASRLNAYQLAVQGLDLEERRLKNMLLSSQIAKLNQVQSTPPFPSVSSDPYMAGQGNMPPLRGSIIDMPLERVVSSPAAKGQEPGSVTEVGFVRTPEGLAPVMSNDAKQRLEEDFLGMLQWNWRNRIVPSLTFGGGGQPPPLSALPKGATHWFFNPVTGTYEPRSGPKAWHNRIERR